MSDEKCSPARNGEQGASLQPTSDNAYPGATLFSASQLARILGLTPARIRQIAQIHGIGKRVGEKKNLLVFTVEDYMLFVEIRKRKMQNRLKRRLPPVRPTDLESFKQYWEDSVQRIVNQVSLMIYEVSMADMNRLTKATDRLRLVIRDIEERVGELEKQRGPTLLP